MAAPAKATEYGLGNYQLGLILPLRRIHAAARRLFLGHVITFIRATAISIRTAPRETRPTSPIIFAANIGILAWFTDATLFGGELGFANTSAFGSDTTTVATPYVDALGADRHVTTQQTVAAFADTEFSAILGWQAGDQHWSLTVSGFVPTGDYNAFADRANGPQSPLA